MYTYTHVYMYTYKYTNIHIHIPTPSNAASPAAPGDARQTSSIIPASMCPSVAV